MYVRNKEKYGEIKEGLFIQHKWIGKNRDKLKNRKPGDKPLAIAEFIQFSSIIEDYKTISEKEYMKCFYNDYKQW